jgi:hypothetical protein
VENRSDANRFPAKGFPYAALIFGPFSSRKKDRTARFYAKKRLFYQKRTQNHVIDMRLPCPQGKRISILK